MKDIDHLPRLYVTGQIAPEGSFVDLFSGTPPFSSKNVIDFLEANKDATEIVVELDTDGGFKSEGINIYNRLRNCGKKVYTIAYKANSIGTVIFLGGSEGCRLVTQDAEFVTHFARIDPINLGIDPLTAADFFRLGEEVEKSDDQILDIYCRELGEERRGDLLAAMAKEENLGAAGAIKLGFANGYYKKKKKAENVKDYLKSAHLLITDEQAALIQNYMNNKQQDDQKTKSIEDAITNGFKSIAKLLKLGKVKNQVSLPLADGTSVYIEPANADAPDELVGAVVYTDETATEKVADGSYALSDGRTIVVAAGVVTEVQPAAEDKSKEVDDLKEQLRVANESIATITAEKEAAQKALADTSKIANQLQKDFTEFKKAVTGDKKEKVHTEQEKEEVDPAEFAKMSRSQKVIVLARQKREDERQRLSAK